MVYVNIFKIKIIMAAMLFIHQQTQNLCTHPRVGNLNHLYWHPVLYMMTDMYHRFLAVFGILSDRYDTDVNTFCITIIGKFVSYPKTGLYHLAADMITPGCVQ